MRTLTPSRGEGLAFCSFSCWMTSQDLGLENLSRPTSYYAHHLCPIPPQDRNCIIFIFASPESGTDDGAEQRRHLLCLKLNTCFLTDVLPLFPGICFPGTTPTHPIGLCSNATTYAFQDWALCTSLPSLCTYPSHHSPSHPVSGFSPYGFLFPGGNELMLFQIWEHVSNSSLFPKYSKQPGAGMLRKALLIDYLAV